MERAYWLVWQGHHSLRIKTSLISHLPSLLYKRKRYKNTHKLKTLSSIPHCHCEIPLHLNSPSATVSLHFNLMTAAFCHCSFQNISKLGKKRKQYIYTHRHTQTHIFTHINRHTHIHTYIDTPTDTLTVIH